ncbi:unnamed protein product [Lymnaea stagnalis]|uniref:GH10 domain-containing protein n=1 Tax=Lymnaea stagnalis TaxID=6523 RepID=A0AAV2IA33_LYMST
MATLPKRLVLLVALSLCLALGAAEILLNPGFENGITNWHSDGFTLSTDTSHVHSGNAAVKCSGRTSKIQGPAQIVHLKSGGYYTITGFIKFVQGVNSHQEPVVTVALKPKSGAPDEYIRVSKHSYMTAADDWVQIGGNFKVPNNEYTQARVYVEGPLPSADFYIDDMSLNEIVVSADWKADANARIEATRKSNIHFNFHLDSNYSPSDVKVRIEHTKHLFGFGSLVRADYMIGTSQQKYKDIVAYMFNWAVLQDYKWPFDKGTQQHPDFSRAVAATDELKRLGLNVRGHCMFWAVPGHEPSWVTPLSGQTLRTTVDNHIKYMMNITKGKLAHWDIYNEDLHGHFYESKLNDDSFSQHLYRAVHAADPAPKLFLNDYNVVAQGISTRAYLYQINRFKAANLGLAGVGVQSHFTNYAEPDMTLVKNRLDVLGSSGLPIWGTELDLAAHDETTRATWYENILRMYFSHKSVEGVLFWGFWDNYMDHDRAIVHGPSLTLDKAGERYLQLTKQEWSTHVNRSLSAGTSFTVRGFQGNYDVIVLHRDKPVKKQSFFVGKADTTVDVTLSGVPQQIQVPAKVNPFHARSVDDADDGEAVD